MIIDYIMQSAGYKSRKTVKSSMGLLFVER